MLKSLNKNHVFYACLLTHLKVMLVHVNFVSHLYFCNYDAQDLLHFTGWYYSHGSKSAEEVANTVDHDKTVVPLVYTVCPVDCLFEN